MMSQEENRHVSQVKRLKPENRGISKAHFPKYLHYIRSQLGTAPSVNEAPASQYRKMSIKDYISFYSPLVYKVSGAKL